MTTINMSHGNAAGLTTNDPAVRVISFPLDFEELYEKYPTYADADNIKIGTLKKGMAIFGGCAEVLTPCTTASVSNITVTDSASKDIVLAITPGTAGIYMGSQATGDMFDVAAAVTFLTADLDIWVNPGAVVPKDGKIEVRFIAAQMANF